MKLTFDGSEWESAVVAKNGTLSAEADLGASYKYVTVLIPTIDSATVSVQGLKASGGTAYPIHDWRDADADGTVLQATTAGTGGVAVTFKCGFQFVKVLCGAKQTTAAVTFYLRGFN